MSGVNGHAIEDAANRDFIAAAHWVDDPDPEACEGAAIVQDRSSRTWDKDTCTWQEPVPPAENVTTKTPDDEPDFTCRNGKSPTSGKSLDRPLRFKIGPADRINKREVRVIESKSGKQVWLDRIDTSSSADRDRLKSKIAERWAGEAKYTGFAQQPDFSWLDAHLQEDTEAADKAIEQGGEAPPDLERLTSRELSEGDFHQDYIIDDLVPAIQGGVCAGPDKNFKTSQAVEIVIAAATATPAFGLFHVREAVRCGMISGEIGKASLKSLGKRVARSKGFELGEIDNAVRSSQVPPLGRPSGVAMLERFIVNDGLSFVAVDPTFEAFSDVGESASNVFRMGAALQPITELIERTGCSILLLHHNRKSRSHQRSEYAPPERSEISQSGFAEWMRFWILTGPRKAFDEDAGEARQWLRVGGSAGHSGLYTLDIHEGKNTDAGGRQWAYTIERASTSRKQDAAAEAKAKEDAQNELLQGHRRKITSVMLKPDFKPGATEKAIREAAGLAPKYFTPALASMLEDGNVVKVRVRAKNKQEYDGWKIKDDDELVSIPSPVAGDADAPGGTDHPIENAAQVGSEGFRLEVPGHPKRARASKRNAKSE